MQNGDRHGGDRHPVHHANSARVLSVQIVFLDASQITDGSRFSSFPTAKFSPVQAPPSGFTVKWYMFRVLMCTVKVSQGTEGP
jgi:hypothetical protein